MTDDIELKDVLDDDQMQMARVKLATYYDDPDAILTDPETTVTVAENVVNEDTVNSWSAGAVGREIHSETTVQVEHGSDTVTVSVGDSMDFIASGDGGGTDERPHVYYAPGDDDLADIQCEACGRQFDQDGWEKTAAVGDAWGGVAKYDCPTDGCDGKATVLF